MSNQHNNQGHDDAPQPGSGALEALLGRIRQTLSDMGDSLGGGAGPQEFATRLSPVIESFLSQFELVPRREFDNYSATLDRLQRTISDLEQRIAQLEARDAD